MVDLNLAPRTKSLFSKPRDYDWYEGIAPFWNVIDNRKDGWTVTDNTDDPIRVYLLELMGLMRNWQRFPS